MKAARLPEQSHTSRESPHPPIDEGPKVQCGALPLQMCNMTKRTQSSLIYSNLLPELISQKIPEK